MIGYVVSRYGALTGRDLEILSHGEPPWALAWARGQAAAERSPKLSYVDMTALFRSAEGDDDPIAFAPHSTAELLRGAFERVASPARPDDLARLQQRPTDLALARTGLC